MQAPMTCTSREVKIPEELRAASPRIDGFFQSLAVANESMLLLDFDGTLAPFRVDPSKVRPWSGVTELLGRIHERARTRLAIVTGRTAEDVTLLLGLQPPVEIWGLHGAERLYPDGQVEREELLVHQQEALRMARDRVHSARMGMALRVEEKWNSIAFHWRGKRPQTVHSARQRTYKLLRGFADGAGMQLLEFDGGIELRAGRDKGDVVRLLLQGSGPDMPVAYLGDDATDENAFAALPRQGLGVLVRPVWRPTAAQVWLRPPGQLLRFLKTWLQTLKMDAEC